MASQLGRLLWGLVGLALLSSACSKGKSSNNDKYNLTKPHVDNQLIITLKPGQSFAQSSSLRGLPIDKTEPLNGESYLIKFSGDVDLEKVAAQIAEGGDVRAVEANNVFHLTDVVPNDSGFNQLWGLKNTGADGGIAGVDIGATQAWEKTTGDKNVLVGIIDSGVDYTHPDLAANIWTNPGETGLDANGNDKRTNGIDDDGDGLVDDWHGWDFFNNTNNPMDDNSHGTHVAGTIGGIGNNGAGVAGVNWNVSILPIKVFSSSGASTTDALVKGIEYATKMGAFVTNNSWGGGAASTAIQNAIQKASDAHILFVAAAGNDGQDNDAVDNWPSNYDIPNIVAVASINRKDELSSFSNWGATRVDVAAPGEDIYSCLPGGTYGVKSGTSMATPHVTGAIALLKARFPDLSAEQIKDKLLSSSQMTAALKGKVAHGRINVATAMEDDTVPPSKVSGLTIVEAGVDSVQVSWNKSGDDGDEGEATSYEIRTSAAALATEADFAAATLVTLANIVETNGVYTATVTNLPYNSSGFLTIKARDNVGNLSEISDSVPYALQQSTVLWSEDNDPARNGWDAMGTPWGFNTIDGRTALSDSPGANYANSFDKSAVTKPIALNASHLNLEISSRYALEKDYDFGYAEVSLDGGLTWIQVGKVNGNSDWTVNTFPLDAALNGAKTFKLRMRLKSDTTVNYAGWDIDSLRIVGIPNP